MHKDFNITQLCSLDYDFGISDLNQLKANFNKLDRLNQILKKILPLQLCDTCHVGAIDEVKNVVVIFVSNQQSFHLLRSLNNHILQAFSEEHFPFNKLLMKVGQYKNSNLQNSQYNRIDAKNNTDELIL